MLTTKERLLFRLELRQCFSATRVPVFVLLILIGVFLVVQESEMSPFVIVYIAVFAILESQFNNIFYRSEHEFETLNMFPISWRRVVFVKNLATIILTGIVSIIVASPVLYFSPTPLHGDMFFDALVYSSTIIFPLLHNGNLESLRLPRRFTGWRTDDLVQAAGMLLFVTVLSFPYIVFTVVFRLEWLSFVYAGATMWYWYNKSIPATAVKIEERKTELCTQ